jgi:hypothetical protein
MKETEPPTVHKITDAEVTDLANMILNNYDWYARFVTRMAFVEPVKVREIVFAVLDHWKRTGDVNYSIRPDENGKEKLQMNINLAIKNVETIIQHARNLTVNDLLSLRTVLQHIENSKAVKKID